MRHSGALRARPTLLRHTITLATSILAPALAAGAQGGAWDLCGAPLVPTAPTAPSGQRPGVVNIEADHATYDRSRQKYTFSGSPVLTRDRDRVGADRIDYRGDTGTIRADGNMRYLAPGVLLKGDRGRFVIPANAGLVEKARYRVSAGHLHGSADRITLIDRKHSEYHNVSLTTCAPGEEVWWLNASELRIDRGARQGYAYNAWLSVKGVPILYTPWMRFPVGSDRLTGLLAPSFGYSEDGGYQLSVPFYWNIAPNYDATFTPSYYSRRGAMLDTEFRYLESWATGEVRAGYLPGDGVTGSDRWGIDQEHHFRYGSHFRSEVAQQRVSDPEYLNDFETSGYDTNRERYLESRGSAAWSEADWSIGIDAQDWQTIDESIAPQNQPYARKPRVRMRYEPYTFSWLDYGVEAEATRFDHDASALRDTGDRFDATARLGLPLETLGYFVRPSVAWRYTGYRLDRPDPSLPEEPQRTLPIYTVDTGLVLEREASAFGRHVTQTLEPRVQYLYIPERDQNDLPRFDTKRASLSYSQLFRENRFTGADRVGDANQVAMGLTTRLIDTTSGREYLALSGGQIVYLSDRDVTLDGQTDTARRSDYIGELRLSVPPGITLDLDGQIDPDNSGNREWRGTLRWRGGPQQVVNVGYRTRQRNDRRTREVGEVSLALPLSPSWTVFGGWRYDMLRQETDNRFTGVEYEGCCYAVRTVYHTELSVPDRGEAELENEILLEFEFKGLGGVGDRIIDFIDSAVTGYRPPRY